jgi:hypothetical protein
MQLFWSKRGIVACPMHAPPLDSADWHTDGWQQVPLRRGFNAAPMQCQFCHGRPYVHHHQDSEGKALLNPDA